ncbi:MAG: GNAT family N-acetyltransferase, partial [Cellulosilyticum sp.]|nr:GNAT family N-acetyltransferase [Cellulosilyticum sp.]
MKVKDIWIKDKQYQLVSDFRDDEEMREKFYQLPKEFFGVDFKAWYELGCWGEGYNPHCLLYQGEVVSNIGVAHQEYIIDGQIKKIIQLGSVGTWKQYRGEGLSRCLMEYVIQKYKNENDAIILFGNDSVVEFYPKFGFKSTKEYCAVRYINLMDL